MRDSGSVLFGSFARQRGDLVNSNSEKQKRSLIRSFRVDIDLLLECLLEFFLHFEIMLDLEECHRRRSSRRSIGRYQTLLLVLVLHFEFEVFVVDVQVDVHLLDFIDTDLAMRLLT